MVLKITPLRSLKKKTPEVRASFFDTDEATKKPALGKAPYVFGDDSS